MVEEASLYEEVLAAREGLAPPEARPPRASAAVVPWRRDAAGEIEVFWVERSRQVRFMPGWHAFPGGTVGQQDPSLPLTAAPAGELVPNHGADTLPASLRGDTEAAPGLLAAALRELFEETGLLLAHGPPPDDLDELRRIALEEPAGFPAALHGRGLTLDASALSFAGRWLTPPFAPLRFDNRFFLLEWPAERSHQPAVWPGELEAGEWIRASEAARRWRDAEVLAAPPIVHILQVLAEDGPEHGRSRLEDPREADLGPVRKVEFRPGILLFPLATATLPPATHTNCFLLGETECVVVDPGSTQSDQQGLLLAALRAAEGQGRRIDAIWITHHHPDHVGGVEALRQALGVPVLAHPATADRLARRGLSIDAPLVDGQRVDLNGFEVRVHHTPGHAPGHLCFEVPRHRSLVCGDLVSALSTIVIDPPYGNMADYLASLERAARLEPKALFPAHGPVVRDGARYLRHVARHRRWREERVLECWEEGVHEPAAIRPRVYEDLPALVWPLAERQIRAHLEHLHAQGRLDLNHLRPISPEAP